VLSFKIDSWLGFVCDELGILNFATFLGSFRRVWGKNLFYLERPVSRREVDIKIRLVEVAAAA
jgi:hypothetical protein